MASFHGFGRRFFARAVWALFGTLAMVSGACDPKGQRPAAEPPVPLSVVAAKATISPEFKRQLGTGDPKDPVAIESVSLSDDGSRLAFGARYAEGQAGVQVWDLSGPAPTKVSEFRGIQATLSPDGKRVACLGGGVFVADVGGEPRQAADVGCVFQTRLTFTPGGDLIATMVDCGGDDKHLSRVVGWDRQGKEKFTLTVGKDEPPVWFSAPFAGGTLLATEHRGYPPTVKVWELPGGKVKDSYASHGTAENFWRGVAVSADGTMMATMLFGKELAVAKLPGGDAACAIGSLLLSRGDVFEFDPTGKVIYYAGQTTSSPPGPGKEVVAVDTASGSSFAAYRGHADAVVSIAISGNGKRMATGSEDGTVKVWELIGK